jgi:hypothetical protein
VWVLLDIGLLLIKRQPLTYGGQVKWIIFSSANGVSSCEKNKFTIGPLRWNVFSQALEVKSFKWIVFMFSEVTLITFISLRMVGHFTPMGINSSDFFSTSNGGHFKSFFSTTNGGLFQMIFFLRLMGVHFTWIFFSLQWGFASKDFSLPRVLFLHFSNS